MNRLVLIGNGFDLAHGLKTYANPKGKDMVMMGELYSYHCMDCNEIVDLSCGHGEKPRKKSLIIWKLHKK